ncbi:MAG TPA: hypothetical protein VHY22_11640 [Chthoniobacteraceae bacterium]|jgi:hypothetical protein|nr:hypothetical protein [Chthoniobacteraceae bacterium]
MSRNCLFAVILSVISLAPCLHADPAGELAASSVFPPVDLNALAGGRVLTARGASLSSTRDMSVQALYLVHAPVARAVELHRNWDAQRHPELKVYLHHDFSTHPTIADFSLPLPGNSAVKKLMAATAKLPSMDDLQLSKAEAGMYKGGGDSAARDFWTQVLFKRATAFLSRGLAGEPAYESADGAARVSEEVSRLLGAQPKLRAAFRPIIEKSPLGGGVGSLPLSPYWELFDVEGEGAFSLGASCNTAVGDGAQMLDLQYYASGGYYVYFTLYQLWPVSVGGKPATLVWRVDSLSSLSFSDLGPFDRKGAGVAMMRDIERMVGFFQKDSGR